MIDGVPKEERTEQWKENGECLKCRRHGYCKKQCTKNRGAMYAEMRRIIRERVPATKEIEEAGKYVDP